MGIGAIYRHKHNLLGKLVTLSAYLIIPKGPSNALENPWYFSDYSSEDSDYILYLAQDSKYLRNAIDYGYMQIFRLAKTDRIAFRIPLTVRGKLIENSDKNLAIDEICNLEYAFPISEEFSIASSIVFQSKIYYDYFETQNQKISASIKKHLIVNFAARNDSESTSNLLISEELRIEGTLAMLYTPVNKNLQDVWVWIDEITFGNHQAHCVRVYIYPFLRKLLGFSREFEVDYIEAEFVGKIVEDEPTDAFENTFRLIDLRSMLLKRSSIVW